MQLIESQLKCRFHWTWCRWKLWGHSWSSLVFLRRYILEDSQVCSRLCSNRVANYSPDSVQKLEKLTKYGSKEQRIQLCVNSPLWTDDGLIIAVKWIDFYLSYSGTHIFVTTVEYILTLLLNPLQLDVQVDNIKVVIIWQIIAIAVAIYEHVEVVQFLKGAAYITCSEI